MAVLNKKKSASARLHARGKSFPVVAIGASAGGLEAAQALFRNLAPDTGMAFIVVQHLNSEHKSLLPSILSKSTAMKVQKIHNRELIKPDNVYVIPNDKGIEVTNGHIRLIPRLKNAPALSIDILFSSLAKTHKKNVIGVILSGNATDGTLGLKAIKSAGGITFAQDHTAKNSSMPSSAISAGIVDYILSPKDIAEKLTSLGNATLRGHIVKEETQNIPENSDKYLNTVFEILHKKNGMDFSHYKPATIKRRIRRRLLKNNIKTLKEYTGFLKKDDSEAAMLHADLLINVTAFFRDAETFRYLKNVFLPKLLKGKKKDETLRIWVPACSTGEEAYSIAMLITEIQEKQMTRIPVQIFATDLSQQVIRDARLGIYSKKELKHFPASRIKRFFIKSGNDFHIVKELRKMCVFACHNILRDPPFINMDFISCRNLLIYFDLAAQKKVMDCFHFALKPTNYLLLGKSETIGSSQLFTRINNAHNIYIPQKNTALRRFAELEPRSVKLSTSKSKMATQKNNSLLPAFLTNATASDGILDNEINSLLLSRYMPACAVINKQMEIIQFRGSTSLFLAHNSGKASLNILKMAKPEFVVDLQVAIRKVFKTKKPVMKQGIEMKIDSAFRTFSIEVSPVTIEWDEPLLMIVFTPEAGTESLHATQGSAASSRRIKKLTDELGTVRNEMQALLELSEKSNEQLQAANEEIVSSNEEFQTLNEELETSKEEIEASNEELISTNQELQVRNDLLTESYHYSEAIFTTIHEPMLILHKNLHIKSASVSFYKKFLTTKEETENTSLFALGNRQWNIPKLHELLNDVLTKNTRFENFEVTHTFPGVGQKVMLLNASRIIQKTHREKLILLAIQDITERTLNQQKADALNSENIRFHEEKKILLESAVKGRTKELLQKNIELNEANIELAFQNNEKEKRAEELGIANIELAYQNNEREKRTIELNIANQDLTSFTYISSHDLQEPLRKIQSFADRILMEDAKQLSEKGKGYFKRMMETAKRMQQLINDLLTYSRTKSDERIFENIDICLLLDDIKKDVEDVLLQKKGSIKNTGSCIIHVIPFQFRQVLQNLVSNSLKYSKAGIPPQIKIKSKLIEAGINDDPRLTAGKSYCQIIYTDNGIGFDNEYKERIFEVFQRLHGIEEFSGTGIGLAICKRIMENHNGLITATGVPGKGSQFDIYIPTG